MAHVISAASSSTLGGAEICESEVAQSVTEQLSTAPCDQLSHSGRLGHPGSECSQCSTVFCRRLLTALTAVCNSEPVDEDPVANVKHFECLMKQNQGFFVDYGDRLEFGEEIGRAAQAKPDGEDNFVAKVFDTSGIFLQDLQQLWAPLLSRDRLLFEGGLFGQFSKEFPRVYALRGTPHSTIRGGTMLKDGSFAFVIDRCWGELRTLIDQKMEANNHKGARPFNLSKPKTSCGRLPRACPSCIDTV